ncbi:Glycosyl transferase family 2 [Marinovum algicola]|uniref:glycosyltransferase family 2 protein n=1 Tax=Marinovum algicola TaxID=42444 RepID=UPI000A1B42AE|nr:glycosyltransferase family 2 protein [Marinovum algicola]SLN76433.1 Glycosyl transferase family 2 [Marinovum algicola]
MPILEADISIIIPTYRYRDKVGHAVRSALASGAGEIIVIDDHGRDGTIEMLAQFDDPRLTVIENPVNLGLWENHLAGLSRATRPWIKFIQADDYLAEGGLARFAQAAGDGVSLVSSCAIMIEEDTGARTENYRIAQPWRVSTEELFHLCRRAGWVLGKPSDVLIRADCIARDPELWVTEISSDLVVGLLAATRGDIALLPSGLVVNVNHSGQDVRTQGPGKGLRRTLRSTQALQVRLPEAHRHFAAEWAAICLPRTAHTALAAVYYRQMSLLSVAGVLGRIAGLALPAYADAASRRRVRDARAYRRARHGLPDLDAMLVDYRQGLAVPNRPAGARHVG